VGNAEPAPLPEPDDRVHVWINERGGGGGYTGYGKVSHFHGQFSGEKVPIYEFRLSDIKILPVPAKGEHFWNYPGDAISSIRRYTLRQMLWMSDPQAKDFEKALREIAEQLFGTTIKKFV
jgi:hypothetical protein